MEREFEILVCECSSTDHQIVLLYSEDEFGEKIYPTCYAHIHLNPLPFWKRFKNGISYILGKRSIYGDFEEFIFSPEDADKLQKLVNYLKNGTQSDS